jgi:beta-lactamase regulating signal transducer with metallopeptidase domain
MTTTGSALVDAIGWTLVHFLWQGALAAAVFAVLDAALRARGARVRYALAAVTLSGMALLPAVTLLASWPTAPSGREAGEDVRRPAPDPRGPAWEVAGAPALRMVPSSASAVRGRVARALPMVVGLWCTGVLVLSMRFLGGWRIVRGLEREAWPLADAAASGRLAALARRMGLRRPVRLLESARVDVPTVVGWLRPAVLLPVATLAGLSPDQVEALLAHELAHVRRHDYLAGLLQGAAETLLFYHPAVWWVSHRMRVLREMCCDDEAVATCGDPVRYARALVLLESLRPGPSLAPAATGGHLLERIARLVASAPGRHVERASRLPGVALFATAVAVGVGGLASLHAAAAPARVMSEPQPAASPETPRPLATPRPPAAPARAGRAVPIERVLDLARAGVRPEYLDAMDAAGYPELSWDQLIALRQQGVGPEYVRGLSALGYARLTPDQLVSLRSQGVSPEYVRGLAGEHLEGLTLSEIAQLRTQGVSPEYVHALRAAGYDRLSVTDLLGARSNGVSGEDAAALRDLGYQDVSLERLIALRATGVGVEYIRGLQAEGYRGLALPTLIGLRSQGVSVEYVRDLGRLGYPGLSAGELIELRSHGVTPEWVRDLQEAGAGHLSTSELVELRSRGVDARLLKQLKARGEGNR